LMNPPLPRTKASGKALASVTSLSIFRRTLTKRESRGCHIRWRGFGGALFDGVSH
jgi:hypothetical protein